MQYTVDYRTGLSGSYLHESTASPVDEALLIRGEARWRTSATHAHVAEIGWRPPSHTQALDTWFWRSIRGAIWRLVAG